MLVMDGILKNPNNPNFQVKKCGYPVDVNKEFSYKNYISSTKYSKLVEQLMNSKDEMNDYCNAGMETDRPSR